MVYITNCVFLRPRICEGVDEGLGWRVCMQKTEIKKALIISLGTRLPKLFTVVSFTVRSNKCAAWGKNYIHSVWGECCWNELWLLYGAKFTTGTVMKWHDSCPAAAHCLVRPLERCMCQDVWMNGREGRTTGGALCQHATLCATWQTSPAAGQWGVERALGAA